LSSLLGTILNILTVALGGLFGRLVQDLPLNIFGLNNLSKKKFDQKAYLISIEWFLFLTTINNF
jgi:hypothetical protein